MPKSTHIHIYVRDADIPSKAVMPHLYTTGFRDEEEFKSFLRSMHPQVRFEKMGNEIVGYVKNRVVGRGGPTPGGRGQGYEGGYRK